MIMYTTGWKIITRSGSFLGNYSKNHIINPEDKHKTLCGLLIPKHAEGSVGCGDCIRCYKYSNQKGTKL